MKSNADKVDWDSLLVQYGIGAFETMRCMNGNIPLLPYHLKRITSVADDWGIANKEVEEKFYETLNSLPNELSRVKILLALNEENVLFSHRYLYPLVSDRKPRKLLLKKVDNLQKQNYKSCNYAFHFLEKKQAILKGYDDVCYEYHGCLHECSSSALLLSNGTLGIVAKGKNLQSVSAAKLLNDNNGYWIKDKISLEKINERDFSLFVSNAVQGIVPVKSLYNENGEIVYESTSDETLNHWNEVLFNE